MAPRVAIVTGGAAGIGGGISRRLAADGLIVSVVDIDGDAAAATAAQIETEGGTASSLAADVTDRDAVLSVVDEVACRLGPPTILVNNAGRSTHRPFLEISPVDWTSTVDINLTSQFHFCQAVLPHQIAAGWGRIVNIASSAVHGGAAFLSAYAVAKSGVVGLTKSLALEFSGLGITVNAVAPGAVETPMFQRSVDSGAIHPEKTRRGIPLGRLGRPDDIARTCSYLVAEEAGYITGQLLGVNGGLNT